MLDINKEIKSFFDSNFPVLHQDKMEILRKRCVDSPSSPINTLSPFDEHGRRSLKSNTTIFAFLYDGGVILAADRRTSSGHYGIYSDRSTKVFGLTSHSGLLFCGDCSVEQYLLDNMRATCESFESMHGHLLSPDGQARWLHHLITGWWFLFIDYWYILGYSIPILAAYDVELARARIFQYEVDGFYTEDKYLVGDGCGFRDIQHVIIDHWKKDITLENAQRLAIRALIHSGIASSGVSDARITPPTLANLDKDGLHWIAESNIITMRDELIIGMEGIKCL